MISETKLSIDLLADVHQQYVQLTVWLQKSKQAGLVP